MGTILNELCIDIPSAIHAEKKEFLNSFIERVNIFPEALPSGRILRGIKFRFPVFFDGQEIKEIGWDTDSTVETVALLCRKS